MQQLEQGFGLRCFRQNQAMNLCINSKCNYNSIMCANQQCRCHLNHVDCPNSTSLSKLKRIFYKKSQSLLPLLNSVYQWLWRQAKLINIEMETLKKIIDSQESLLSGSQKKLFKFLNEKNLKQIMPKLVADVMNSLDRQPEYNLRQIMLKINKQLEIQENSFKSMVKQVQKFAQAKISIFPSTSSNSILDLPKPNFNFSHKLKSSRLYINEKSINVKDSFNFAAGFLQPELLDSHHSTKTVSFKIKTVTMSDIMFGVCQITPDLKPDDPNIFQKMQYGSFSYYNCVIHLGSKLGHRKQSSNIQEFLDGNVIQLIYESKDQKVTVKNLTRKTESISYINTDKVSPLYFVVLMLWEGDKVELLEN